jgi:DNA polymerase III subunit delta'
VIDLLPWHRQSLDELLARRASLPHAMLIHGKQGIGKVEFARAIAQSLLCESPEDGIACGTCNACGWYREGNHPDFRELVPENLSDDDSDADGATDGSSATDGAKEKKKSKEIKIDQVRELAQFMTLSTHRDGFRVLLIYPAETMNLAAANALLKTLEEPPPRTVILLVTDQMARLLATIRSRCQRILLAPPTVEEALKWLEGQNILKPETALAMAGGAPLDAIVFADRTYQTERQAFLSALTDAQSDYVAAAQSFEKSDLVNIVTWLQTWVADIVIAKLAGQIRHHVDHQKEITRIATRVELPKLFRYESALRQTRRSISHPLNARLLLEQLLISYQQAIR